MTKEEAAAALDGNEYRDEGSHELFVEMEKSRLICLFGYSDDVMEVRGVSSDEMGAGSTLYFDENGLLQNRCDEDDCPYFAEKAERAARVEIGSGQDGGMFDYITDIPHARFKIMEDGEFYSAGIVFSLADIA
ncbi:MAG TPA: hypothetical protein VGQ34_11555 [Sphingomicrobium sp.]|jgi:hypothetical protein|nr:hypothetical protein [Sphingomicrobium sp.]